MNICYSSVFFVYLRTIEDIVVTDITWVT